MVSSGILAPVIEAMPEGHRSGTEGDRKRGSNGTLSEEFRAWVSARLQAGFRQHCGMRAGRRLAASRLHSRKNCESIRHRCTLVSDPSTEGFQGSVLGTPPRPFHGKLSWHANLQFARIGLAHIAPQALLWHPSGVVKKINSAAVKPNESDELRQEIAGLRDEICTLINAIDEVREELHWLTRNGLPVLERTEPPTILKQMAANPCATDWGERLVIVRGDSATASGSSKGEQEGSGRLPLEPGARIDPESTVAATSSPAPATGKPPPGKLFTDPGEQRRLF